MERKKTANQRMQPTALRAAADAGRWANKVKFIGFIVLGLAFGSVLLSAEEALQSFRKLGTPTVVALDCDVVTDQTGNTKIRFFGVAPNRLSTPYAPGTVLAFSEDRRLARHIEYHFADLKKSEKGTAFTMFGSSVALGTQIVIFRVISSEISRREFVGRARIVFLDSEAQKLNGRPKETEQEIGPNQPAQRTGADARR